MARRGTPLAWGIRKQVQELAKREDVTLRQIARALGLSHNTVKKYLGKFDQNAFSSSELM